MWEFGEDLWRTVKFTTGTWVGNPWKATWEAHVESWIVKCHFTSHFAIGPTHKWPTKFSIWLILNVLSLLLYLHYINSYYPWNCNETFREKILEIHLRVRDCKLTIIYTISLSFPLLLLLKLHIFESFLAQTHTSPNLSVENCFGACGKH